jgi:hypothetical protein
MSEIKSLTINETKYDSFPDLVARETINAYISNIVDDETLMYTMSEMGLITPVLLNDTTILVTENNEIICI